MEKRNPIMVNSVSQAVPWLLVALLGLSLILSSCGLSDGISYKTPVPVATVHLSYPQQQLKRLEIWLDNTSSYPRTAFRQSAQSLATAIDQAIQPNSDGLAVNVSLIGANSFDPASTVMSFVVPPIAAYPKPATRHSDDFYIQAEYTKEDEQAFRQQVQAFVQSLARIRAQVRQFTDTLRALNPAPDTTGLRDYWGMLNRASQHLQGGRSPKYLLIAGTLLNTTWQEFIPGDALWGTKVRVYYAYCTDAPTCTQNTAFWVGVFEHARATDVRVYDFAQSQTLALSNRLLV